MFELENLVLYLALAANARDIGYDYQALIVYNTAVAYQAPLNQLRCFYIDVSFGCVYK